MVEGRRLRESGIGWNAICRAYQLSQRTLGESRASLHMQTADDLFGGPQGSPRTDKLIAASIQWAERIMTRIDDVFGK